MASNLESLREELQIAQRQHRGARGEQCRERR